MKRKPVAVAVPVGEDLRLGARATHVRIVLGHAALVRDPQHLPDVVAEILRLHPQAVVLRSGAAQPVAVADRDVQRAIRAEQHPSGHVARGFPRIGDEDLADVGERRASSRPRDTASVFPRLPDFGCER